MAVCLIEPASGRFDAVVGLVQTINNFYSTLNSTVAIISPIFCIKSKNCTVSFMYHVKHFTTFRRLDDRTHNRT